VREVVDHQHPSDPDYAFTWLRTERGPAPGSPVAWAPSSLLTHPPAHPLAPAGTARWLILCSPARPTRALGRVRGVGERWRRPAWVSCSRRRSSRPAGHRSLRRRAAAPEASGRSPKSWPACETRLGGRALDERSLCRRDASRRGRSPAMAEQLGADVFGAGRTRACSIICCSSTSADRRCAGGLLYQLGVPVEPTTS
jgi:hypothetical protein